MAEDGGGEVPRTFRALVESADRKFARVRGVPTYGKGHNNHYLSKVFKVYTRLWRFQQENRSKLVGAGLQRWEIGEIASRIGQLYFGQYMRTSEARFLFESYIFYEAILNRGYFQGSRKGSARDLGLRFKELRFYARFLVVSLLLNRSEMVQVLVERFRALVDDSKATFRDTNFKEWKLVVQEIIRFIKVDTAFTNPRPLRYCAMFDSHPASRPYVARFHANKVLKFQDALLASYHRNEVKFAELTLDTFRMLQCLEWEPSGSFYQKHLVESKENGTIIDHSGASGLIDINLAADMTDPTLPPNPRKAVVYHPSVTHLIAVIATICEELPLDSVVLIYLSASGKAGCSNVSQSDSSGGSGKSSKIKDGFQASDKGNKSKLEVHGNGKVDVGNCSESCLWLGPRGNEGLSKLYPADIIPFTRKPLFLIIDSDNSHAFKAGLSELGHCFPGCFWFILSMHSVLKSALAIISQNIVYASNHVYATYFDFRMSSEVFLVPSYEIWEVDLALHGAERGETAALFLSPLRPVFKSPSGSDVLQNGSQFTFFLTSPLQAFYQLVGFSTSETEGDIYNDAVNILATAFSEWEVILCTSRNLNLVWAQVLSDPLLRRLILRFIFCRSVLSLFSLPEASDSDLYLPLCLPHLPDSVAPNSEVVKATIVRLANRLKVAECFLFNET